MEISDSDKALLWKTGRLRFKLHAGQRELHDHYRKWEKHTYDMRKREEKLPGKLPRVYVADCSRRFGKDFFGVLARIEDAIQRPGSVLTYGTAFQKDIVDIVIPLFEQITGDCPSSMRPSFRGASQNRPAGFFFPNKSFIKLVGVDKDPDGLRGRFSDGITLSEAGFVDHLKDVIVDILMPQLQGRLHATIMLNSTPPKIPGHAYDDLFCPDAIERDAYFMRTIEDNPLLSDAEREEFIEAAGGRGAETCDREYFCKRIRSETRVVLPEFNPEIHVRASKEPEFALGFTVVDAGIKDMTAVLCGWYDFERAKLVIRKDWAKAGANTDEVLAALRVTEAHAFGNLKYWAGSEFKANPFMRYSDTDLRLITDLNQLHGLKIGTVEKSDAEAALQALRTGLRREKIEIHPECKVTISHATNAVWDKSRSSYERSELFGHFDAVDCLKYMNRMANRTTNPYPPKGITLQSVTTLDNIFHRPEDLKTRRTALDTMKEILPKGWRVRGRR